MGIHSGHRQRLKDRFLSQGLAGFEDHNVLELLLFYSIPRSDTNEIAHHLIKEFKTLSGVFDAPVEELCRIKGVSMHTATLIKLIPQLFSAYQIDKTKATDIINTIDDLGRYFMPRFYGKKNEEVHIMLLDNKNKVLKCEKIFEGTVNATTVTVKKIVTEVINGNASSVVLAHNHPGGIALPSSADIKSTEKVFQTLKMINVTLYDHIIVADGDFVSMRASGDFERFYY